MDSALIPEGVKRCSITTFLMGLSVAALVLAVGVYAMLECWIRGLNVTGMNDYYGFALWIWADLAVIALGGGAFFSGHTRNIPPCNGSIFQFKATWSHSTWQL